MKPIDTHQLERPQEEGLGAVDGIDHPDALPFAVGRGRRLLAQERVLREGFGEPVTDQQFGVEVRLAGQVLRALVLDGQLVARVEIAQRRLARLADEREAEVDSVRSLTFQSFQSQAAPRTPLASPCLLRRMGVWNTVEKVRAASAGGRSS